MLHYGHDGREKNTLTEILLEENKKRKTNDETHTCGIQLKNKFGNYSRN